MDFIEITGQCREKFCRLWVRPCWGERAQVQVGQGGRNVLDDVSEDSDSDEMEGQAVYCIQRSEEQYLDLCARVLAV